MNLLFHGVDKRFFEKVSFAIGWQMQGSGLSYTRTDMLAMSVNELVRSAQAAHDQRAREAAAIRAAYASRKT